MTEQGTGQDPMSSSTLPREPGEEPGDASLDMDQLALRVFALLKQELVIERERMGRWGPE